MILCTQLTLTHLSVDFRVLKEAEPVNGVVSVMRQLGVDTGSEEKAPTNNLFTSILPEISCSMATNGLQTLVHTNSSVPQLKTQNSINLQELINSLAGKLDINLVACFNVDKTNLIYVDFRQRSGKNENESK